MYATFNAMPSVSCLPHGDTTPSPSPSPSLLDAEKQFNAELELNGNCRELHYTRDATVNRKGKENERGGGGRRAGEVKYHISSISIVHDDMRV